MLRSAASLAAQSGPTSFVTTDANGNLAAASFSPQQMAQGIERRRQRECRPRRGVNRVVRIVGSISDSVIPVPQTGAAAARGRNTLRECTLWTAVDELDVALERSCRKRVALLKQRDAAAGQVKLP